MPDSSPDAATMLYRIQSLEHQLKQVQEQLKAYVPIRENELQLAAIQASVTRMERDVIDMKAKQETMEKEARVREEEQKVAQANLQVKVLWGIVSVVITVVTLIFVGYVNHFFK